MISKTVKHRDGIPFFGDKNLLEISNKNSFAQTIYELISNSVPDEKQLKLFNLILNLSIDHGEETPSAIETIKFAGQGKSISESVAAGVNQINNTHGGAIEPAMELIYEIEKNKLEIKDVIQNLVDSNQKIPGFGHRIYEVDPRTELIFKTATEFGLEQKYINIANEISNKLSLIKNKKLPTNIDGAIAAILCTFGWKPNLGKAVFIIARTPGLCGQYLNHSLKN